MAHLESPMLIRTWPEGMDAAWPDPEIFPQHGSFSRSIHRGVPLRHVRHMAWLVGTPIISFDDFPTGLPNSPILYGWLCKWVIKYPH